MKEIYADSFETVVWLGPPDEMSYMAFSKIISLSESWNERPTYLKTRALNGHLQEYTNFLRSEFSGEDPIQPWHAVHSLSSRAWFQRAWVVQEINVAPTTIFLCGDRAVDMVDLLNTRQVIVQHCGCMEMATDFKIIGMKEVISSVLMISGMWQDLGESIVRYRSQTSSTAGSSLIAALDRLRFKYATEPHDKVYAARGLAGTDGQMTPVDYSLPIKTVYASMAQRLIHASQSFYILAYCHYPPKVLDLPTWAADWSDTSCPHRVALPQEGFQYHESLNQEKVYHTTKESEFYVRFEHGNRTMVVKGAWFDRLAFTSSSGIRSYGIAGVPQQKGLDIQAVARDAEEANQTTMDYIAITHKAKWLREWALFLSDQEATSFPMIDRTGWSFNPDVGRETFKQPFYSPTEEDLLSAYLTTLIADVMVDQDKGHEIRVPSTQEYISWVIQPEISLEEVFSFRLEGRAFAVSDLGLIALVPAEARAHDLIAIVQGSDLPFILRPSGNGFSFIGQAYVHGIMDGETWSLVEDGTVPLEEIPII
ncbi:MAG: hypothetical protein Q9225_006311 [Loekoesia sp. 1 TL-2023]